MKIDPRDMHDRPTPPAPGEHEIEVKGLHIGVSRRTGLAYMVASGVITESEVDTPGREIEVFISLGGTFQLINALRWLAALGYNLRPFESAFRGVVETQPSPPNPRIRVNSELREWQGGEFIRVLPTFESIRRMGDKFGPAPVPGKKPVEIKPAQSVPQPATEQLAKQPAEQQQQQLEDDDIPF